MQQFVPNSNFFFVFLNLYEEKQSKTVSSLRKSELLGNELVSFQLEADSAEATSTLTRKMLDEKKQQFQPQNN